jgi:hypothetical protein
VPEFYTAERTGHVLTVTLNRPERLGTTVFLA